MTDRKLDESDQSWLRSVFDRSRALSVAAPDDTKQQVVAVLEPELERLVDEYYQAAGVDPRRLALLRGQILEQVATLGLELRNKGS